MAWLSADLLELLLASSTLNLESLGAEVLLLWKSVGFLKLKYEQGYLYEIGMKTFFHRLLWQRQLGIWSDGV